MVKSCSALNCLERWDRNIKKKFHRIPQKNLELRTKWLDALRRINYDPKDAFICEKHFTASDYEFNVHGNRNLKKGAVPSVFDFPVCPSKRTSKQIKPQQLTNVQDGVIKIKLSGEEAKNERGTLLNNEEIEANVPSTVFAEDRESDEEMANDVNNENAGLVNKSTEEDPSAPRSEEVYIKSENIEPLTLVHFQPDGVETNKSIQIKKEGPDKFENLKEQFTDHPETQHQCTVLLIASSETDHSTSENEECKLKFAEMEKTPFEANNMNDGLLICNDTSISALNDSTEDHHSNASSEELQIISYKRNRRDPIYFGDFEEADLDCPIKRSRFWRVAQEIVLKQKQRIKFHQCRERKQNDQILKLKRIIKEAKDVQRKKEISGEFMDE